MESILKENIEIQDAEMECLLNTFGASDPHISLEYNRNTRTGSFCVQASLADRKLRLAGIRSPVRTRNDFLINAADTHVYLISHLPPLNLHFGLPAEYPGRPPNAAGPNIFLTSVWLPASILRQLCDRLNQFVSENSGEAVLWLLIEWLRDESSSFYLDSGLNVNTDFSLDLENFYEQHRNEMPLSFSNCSELLVAHNDDQLDIEFQLGTWECPVCAEDYLGSQFFRFPMCGHRCCKSCVRKAFILAIEGGLMSSRISCLECGQDAGPHEARSVLPDEWYSKYELLTLKHGLDLMHDVVHCPRPGCETVVILDDENLGRCPKCELSFCPRCLRTYHGAARCVRAIPMQKKGVTLTEEDLKRLKEEEEATEKFLDDTAKSCPGCHAFCLKSGGCNKMVCLNCQIFFCWLCGQPIYNRSNPYSHYQNGTCLGKLFEGVIPEDDNDDLF